jgi:Papain-like cysteine protease AvrRpt2
LRTRRLVYGGVMIALAAAAPAAPPAALPDRLLIEGVPHVRQEPDFCGEACVAMALARLGHPADQRAVFDRTGLDPLLGRGAYTPELKRAIEAIGFRPGAVWFHVAPARAERELAALLDGLRADLARGVPSIVCMRYGEATGSPEHFRLVLGYDNARGEVIYHEPAEDGGAYRRMSRARFLSLWPLKYRRDDWTVVRFALEPGRIELARASAGVTPADHAQHVMATRTKIPRGYATRIAGPFFVIGDETPAALAQHTRTIEWTMAHLKQDFGMREPTGVIDIWLLGSDDSYVDNAVRLWGKRPSTPYGFFLPEHHTLFMNIATGGGTLVHEVVHPFIAASFPDVPAWFNEGLASLYEAVREKNGQLWGLPNWRLAGLKRAVADGRVPTFEAMATHGNDAFYASPTGYAQARYLCLYLQEKRLLRRYYKEFRAGAAADATGYATLKRILGHPDMKRFQSDWEAWVMKLQLG